MIIHLTYGNQATKTFHGSFKTLRKLAKARPWIARAIEDGIARRAVCLFRTAMKDTDIPSDLDSQLKLMKGEMALAKENNCAEGFFFGAVDYDQPKARKVLKVMYREA